MKTPLPRSTPRLSTLARLRRSLTPLALAVLLSGVAHAEETSYTHRVVMRGQILEQEGSGLVVCVGEADGAKVGQVLDVVRHTRIARSPKAPGPRYRREDIGQVRITELFDEHYANAEIVTGEPAVHDTVELLH